jgi:hypothetical protein
MSVAPDDPMNLPNLSSASKPGWNRKKAGLGDSRRRPRA